MDSCCHGTTIGTRKQQDRNMFSNIHNTMTHSLQWEWLSAIEGGESSSLHIEEWPQTTAFSQPFDDLVQHTISAHCRWSMSRTKQETERSGRQQKMTAHSLARRCSMVFNRCPILSVEVGHGIVAYQCLERNEREGCPFIFRQWRVTHDDSGGSERRWVFQRLIVVPFNIGGEASAIALVDWTIIVVLWDRDWRAVIVFTIASGMLFSNGR
jgi:hypothetical protein